MTCYLPQMRESFSNWRLNEASQTYVQAQQAIMAGLAKDGWTVKAALKVPQALSPDKSYKLFFKAQAIYLGQGDSDLGSARSLHLADIRGGTYEKFKADLARWTKTESKQHGCGCSGECECAEAEGDIGRSDMEKAIFKAFPPDSKKKKGGKSVVMFTGDVAKAAGVLDYTSMPLSDLTDKQVKAVYARIAKKESVEVAPEFRERAGIAGAHGDWTLGEGKPEYECLECGKKFSAKAAMKAQENGCPKCGGTDIDLASDTENCEDAR